MVRLDFEVLLLLFVEIKAWNPCSVHPADHRADKKDCGGGRLRMIETDLLRNCGHEGAAQLTSQELCFDGHIAEMKLKRPR
jgi:hypothetical protein